MSAPIIAPQQIEPYGRHDRRHHTARQKDAVALTYELGVDVMADHQSHRAREEASPMSEPIHITADTAIQLLRAAVAEHGERHTTEDTAEHTLYAYQGRPSCIVACALAHAGVPVGELATLDQLPDNGIVSVTPPAVAIDDAARDVLYVAQLAQDAGLGWGQVLADAETRREDLVIA